MSTTIAEELAKLARPDEGHTVRTVLTGHWLSARANRESVATMEVQCENPLISYRLAEIGQAYQFIEETIDKVLILAPPD